MKLKFSISIILFFVLNVSNAQYIDGFVITSDGDTINGTLKNLGITTSCSKVKFYYDNGEKGKFKVGNLKGYQRGNEAYVVRMRERPLSLTRPMKSFMKVLDHGKVNLYEYNYTVNSGGYMGAGGVMVGSYSSNRTDYYLEKSSGQLMLVRTGNFKKEMSNYFKNNKDLSASILEKELRYNDIEEIVRIYNSN